MAGQHEVDVPVGVVVDEHDALLREFCRASPELGASLEREVAVAEIELHLDVLPGTHYEIEVPIPVDVSRGHAPWLSIVDLDPAVLAHVGVIVEVGKHGGDSSLSLPKKPSSEIPAPLIHEEQVGSVLVRCEKLRLREEPRGPSEDVDRDGPPRLRHEGVEMRGRFLAGEAGLRSRELAEAVEEERMRDRRRVDGIARVLEELDRCPHAEGAFDPKQSSELHTPLFWTAINAVDGRLLGEQLEAVCLL